MTVSKVNNSSGASISLVDRDFCIICMYVCMLLCRSRMNIFISHMHNARACSSNLEGKEKGIL